MRPGLNVLQTERRAPVDGDLIEASEQAAVKKLSVVDARVEWVMHSRRRLLEHRQNGRSSARRTAANDSICIVAAIAADFHRAMVATAP